MLLANTEEITFMGSMSLAAMEVHLGVISKCYKELHFLLVSLQTKFFGFTKR